MTTDTDSPQRGNPAANTWCALEADIRSVYDAGVVISGADQLIEDIDRVDNRQYASIGLSALAEQQALKECDGGFRVLGE